MEQDELDKKVKRVEERHQHSRGLAGILSATIIGISGGLFYALMGEAAPLDRFARLLLGLSVVGAVLLQFCHVLGYVHHARAINKHFMASIAKSTDDRKELYTKLDGELKKAKFAFSCMDVAVWGAVGIHIAGLVLVGIGHI